MTNSHTYLYTFTRSLKCIFIFVLFYVLASGFDFTVRENGLQVDQPPIIGNISTVWVTIAKNDNAEGVIEFDLQYVHLQGKFTLSSHYSLEDKAMA